MGWGCEACGGDNPEGTRFCGWCGIPNPDATTTPTGDLADALRSLAEARAAEERRLVTALFADISGFTSLSEQLDAEDLHAVIAPVISRLAAVAERYEGFIAKYAGDALLVFFGAPVAHEDDAARALLVALEMHEAILDNEHGLTLHIGVNTGRVISGRYGGEARADYSILGDAVNLAQRLESVAPSGETYVGETTYRITAHEFAFEEVGPLTLKGKAHPVPGYRLLGRRTPATASTGKALIGRDRELAEIEAAGGTVALAGEPGIGKTRLLAELRDRAEGRWLQARCLSYGAGLAYWPFADLLRRTADIRPEDDPAVAVERLPEVPGHKRAFLARLAGLPDDDPDVAALDPEAFRRGLHDTVVAWFASMAPATLAIEDVHWIDTSSLELLGALVGTVDVVLTTRPEGVEACRSVGAHVVALGPLDEAGVRALVGATLGGSPPLDLVRVVLARTNGNPLFVEELTRSLVEQGDVVAVDGRFSMRSNWDAVALPDTVERVLASRIDALPPSACSVLQTASVIGRVTRRSLLDAVLGERADVDADADVARLVEAGFLEPAEVAGEDGLAFHHALVQDVAYSRMLAKHRRELHLRVAEVAEGLYGSGDDVIDLLARELYLGGAGGRAVDYLVRAGHRAAGLFANDEAIVHLERAAEVALEHDPERRPALVLEVGELHELVGHFEEARRRYREAGDDVRAWRGAASTLRKQGAYAETLAVLEQAFEAAPPAGTETAALWLEKGWTLCLNGELDDGLAALHAGLAAAGETEDPVVGRLLVEIARVHLMAGRNAEALEHGLRAQRVFEAAGELRGLTTALRVVGDVYGYLGDREAAVQTLRRGLELARRVGRPEEIGGCLVNLGMVELERGDLAAATACDREAVEQFETIGHESGRATAYANLAEKLLLTGEVDEAEERCLKALSLARGISLTYTVADATQTLGSIRLQQGDAAAAGRLFAEAADLFGSMGIDGRRDHAARLAASLAS